MGKLATVGEHFGRWLRARRSASGLTLNDLGKRLGCSTNAVSRMELGTLNPSDEMRGKLAEVFALPVGDVAIATFPDQFKTPEEREWLFQWLSIEADRQRDASGFPTDTAPPRQP